MTRPRDELRAKIAARCAELGWPDAADIVVERPADPAHGDWATPAALALARLLKRPPREIATEIVRGLRGALDPDRFAEVSVAGPGFINVRLAGRYLRETVARILAEPAAYGRSPRLAGRAIDVEFVSSNPTGPLHVGHARNAVLGDAIAALLESQGAAVTREYYFNDAGRQMDALGASVYARYRQQWESEFPFPEEGYEGAYIGDLAAELTAEAGERYRRVPLDDCLPHFRRFAGERISEGIRADLDRFRVRFDIWFNESTLYENGRLESAIADLRAADAVYDKDGATWFRASAFGDSEDRVLIKSSGQPTYLLPDIAYHRDKHERGFDAAVDVWGADHHSYAIRMQAALGALGYPPGWLRTVIYQQISLVEAGREVRLSTRRNRMVTLAELMDDIGVDVTRYFLLMRKGDTPMVFDLDLARRQSEENPVYYVQYAHARIAGVFEKLEEPSWDPARSGPPDSLGRLVAPTEMDLLRALDDFPDVVSDAADALEPHRVTDFLESLARRLHLWYHAERILVDDEPLARARLGLARATQHVLREGLGLLGVTAPSSM
ncbi:MAG TPA: arginine--tRNA ligase [Gemmatimonadota bacterium]|nr:arginine--tRNA ligase [Gemmatimonadota bacterium]